MAADYTIIDLTYLNEISDNNDEIKRVLIDIFLSQIPEFNNDFKEYLKSKNWKALALVAHKAKSSVMSMGMEELGKIDLKNLELLSNKLYLDQLELKDNKSEKELNEINNIKLSFDYYPSEKKEWIEVNATEKKIDELVKRFSEICNNAAIELNCELNKLIY